VNCSICKVELNVEGRPETLDCGGDCLACMAFIGNDPDCVATIKTLSMETQTALCEKYKSSVEECL
jgi:hypothetical protein